MLTVQPLVGFAAIEPLGSLAYLASSTADLTVADSSQSFTLDLDGQQSLSATVLAPFQAEATLTGPGGNVLTTVTSVAAGEPLVVLPRSISTAGVYTLTIEAADGGVGLVDVTAWLNASPELEQFGGPSNSTPAEAESLAGAFTPLGIGGTEKAAIVGRTSPSGPNFTSSASDPGSELFFPNSTNLELTATAIPSGPATLTFTVTADLNASAEFLTIDAEGLFSTDLFVTGGVESAVGIASVEVPQSILAALAADGVVSLTVRPSTGVDSLVPTSLTVDLAYPAAAPDGDDWYVLSLDDDQRVSIAMDSSAGGLELYAADGVTLLASGSRVAALQASISEFRDTTADGVAEDYLLRVLSTTGDYSLHVVRDGLLAVEAGASPVDAFDLGSAGTTLLGHVSEQVDGTPIALPTALSTDSLSIGFASDGSFIGSGVGIERAGVEFLDFGTPLAGYTIAFDDQLFVNRSPESGIRPFSVTATDLSRGATKAVLFTGEPIPGVTFSRLVQWSDGEEVVHVTTTIDNQTGATLSNLALLDNIDPDPAGTFATANDVVDAASALIVASGSAGTIGLGSTAADAVVSTADFVASDPFPIINSPIDPNGSSDDDTINLAFDLGELPPGAAVSRTFQLILGADAADVQNKFASLGPVADLPTTSVASFFRFEATAGDILSITATSPASGPGDFVNDLDVGIELVGPGGAAVPHTNAPGGETLTAIAAETGQYTLRVFGEAESSGEYVVNVAGTTGADAPFTVVDSSVTDGERFPPGALRSLTLDLSDSIRLDTVGVTDLLVNGVADAVGLTIDDSDTLTFDLPSTLVDGPNTLSLPAGSLTGLSGQPLEAFELTVILDQSGPRVVASSVLANDVLGPGEQTFTFDFDEPLDESVINASGVELVGTRTGIQTITALDYDASGQRLTFTATNLAEDVYTLRLRDVNFRDLLGNLLDGEVDPSTTIPSGDGTPGGDFSLPFSVDIGVNGLSDFVRQVPDGSLVYRAGGDGFISPTDDIDSFDVYLDAGQTLTLAVQGQIDPVVELFNPNGVSLGTAVGSGAGTAVLLQTASIDATGVYRISIGAQSGTTGAFSVRALLNSQEEFEEFGGVDNGTPANAEDLIFTRVIGGGRGGALADRAAVSGFVSNIGPTYTATATDTNRLFFPNNIEFAFDGLPTPIGDATITLTATGDFGSTNEYLDVGIEGFFTQRLFAVGGSEGGVSTAVITVPLNVLRDAAADGSLMLTATPSSAVDNFGGSALTVDLSFPIAGAMGDDWFRLELGDGAAASLALDAPNAGLELYTDNGVTLLAAGRRTAEGLVSIDHFVDLTSDGTPQEYLVRVVAGVGAYNLVATRGAVFDREGNDDPGTAQELNGAQGAVGFVTGPDRFGVGADDDWYVISLEAGDRLTSQLVLPAAGPGEFENALAGGLPGGLILSEIVDGTGDSGNPKFVEITNTTASAYTFPAGGLIVQTNDSVDRTVDINLSGVTIPARGSYVIGSSANGGRAVFESVYGFAADLYADELIGDGNDRYALTDTNDGSSILDTYGVLDTNGVGSPWEYTDAYAVRLAGAIVPVGEGFNSGEWLISGVGALNDGVTPNDDLLRTLTTPGSHDYVAADSSLARVTLYDPSGSAIVDGVALSHTAAEAGEYRLRVSALALQGEYALKVSGATGTGVAPAVLDTTPRNGELLRTVPTEYTVVFSEPLLEGAIGPEDLSINGILATGVTQLDAVSFRFDIDASVDTGDGVYNVSLPAGAVTDLQGLGNAEYTTTFVVDGTAPRIDAAQIDGADLVLGVTYPAGDHSVSVRFNEPIDESLVSGGSVNLLETISGTAIDETAFAYDSATQTLTVDYASLAEGAYEFTVIGATIVDFAGNQLDGEPLGTPLDGAPTGDGVPGGNYTLGFQVDAVGVGSLAGFERLRPLGGLASASLANAGILNAPGDFDDVMLDLAAGEIIAAVVTPLDPNATVTVTAIGLSGPFASSTPGAPATLAAAALPIDTPLTLRVVGDRATPYRLDVYLNTSLEAQVIDSGIGSALSIDSSLLALPERRYAVLGEATPIPSRSVIYTEDFNLGAAGFAFNNAFGDGGGLWGLSTGRQLDGQPNHSAPNSLYFGQNEGPFGGGDYDSGSIAEGVATSPLISLPNTGGAWLSFSQLLQTDRLSDLAEVSVVAGSTSTPVLSTIDGSLPTDTGGVWQQVAADLSAFAGQSIRLQFRFDTVDDQLNEFEGWYIDDLRIEAAADAIADLDAYTFTAAGGSPIEIIFAGQEGTDFTGATLQVIDPFDGAVLAEGSADPRGEVPTNYEQAVLDFTPDRPGTYGIRVVSQSPGLYGLVVTEALQFEAEPNSSSGSPLVRELALGDAGLGYLDGDPGGGSLWGVQPATGMIVRVDAATGSTTDAFAAPGNLQPGHTRIGLSLAEGGEVLLYQNSQDSLAGTTTLYRLNPETGEVLSTEMGDTFSPDGLSHQTDVNTSQDLIFQSHPGADLHRQSGYSGPTAFFWGPGATIGGVGGDDNGRLFANYTDGQIHEVNPFVPTSFIGSFSAPASDIQGLAFSGELLYASSASGEIFTLDPDTGEVLSQAMVEGGPLYGLGARGTGGLTDAELRDVSRVASDRELPIDHTGDENCTCACCLATLGTTRTESTPGTAGAEFGTNNDPSTAEKEDQLTKAIGTELADLYREFVQGGVGLAAAPGVDQAGAKELVEVQAGFVLIDAFAEGSGNALLTTLTNLGMQSGSVFGRTVSGWLPVDTLDDLAALPEVRFARPSYRPLTNVGRTTSQADVAMGSDTARSTFGVDGSGVTIGVLSDSFGFTGSDIASGDLPGPGNPLGNTTPIQILSDTGGSDEGRAMAQLIHDVAPGAGMAFHTAFNGQADFANGIIELREEAGSDVIVDDVIYFAEPMFQDGIIAQAIDTVVADGATYFSSAGNNGRDSWEDAFRDSGENRFGTTLHDFDAGSGVDTLQSINVPRGSSVRLVFQWDSPFFSVSGGAGTQNDVDVFVLDSTGNSLVASATTNNIGGDALEVFTFTNNTLSSSLNLAVGLGAGAAPGLMKWVAFDTMVVNEYATNSATAYGHANAAGASAVGAVDYRDTPAFGAATFGLESFSSAGGIPTLFDTTGQPINELRAKPNLVAPDGTNTTFFGSDSDADGFPNFFGTSAAAPHAAAVAALMSQLSPLASPSEIYEAMESSAIDMDDPATPGFDVGFDSGTGAGFLDAVGALSLIVADPAFVGPRVAAISPEAGMTTDLNVTELTIDFSEPLDPAAANDPANYRLVGAGSDGVFDTADDQRISTTPAYDGSTTVTLTIDGGTPLAFSRYRLTLEGDALGGGIIDVDGNPLNSLDGPGFGSDTTHEFEVVLQLPTGGDFYRLTLAAGEGVLLETALPTAGPSAPKNTLDAQITVFGPTGLLVGTDQDGADGLNASIGFVAPDEGVYTIQVTAEEGEGEYLLRAMPATFLLPGDFNLDGRVNAADYTLWREQDGQTLTPFTGADINGDGFVDAIDKSVWRANYGLTTATATPDHWVRVSTPSIGSLTAPEAADDALAASTEDATLRRSASPAAIRGAFEVTTTETRPRTHGSSLRASPPRLVAETANEMLLLATLDSAFATEDSESSIEPLAEQTEDESSEIEIDRAFGADNRLL